MPSLKNVLPKYRKHRASGQAVVSLSGIIHYLGPYGTKASKLEYDRLIVEWLQNGRQDYTPTQRRPSKTQGRATSAAIPSFILGLPTRR